MTTKILARLQSRAAEYAQTAGLSANAIRNEDDLERIEYDFIKFVTGKDSRLAKATNRHEPNNLWTNALARHFNMADEFTVLN